MKYLNQNLPAIKKEIEKAGGSILILDFDGTLSPIAQVPGRARLPEKTKQEIKNCLSRFPVVIVSGRALADIKKKMGIKGLIYAGSHGLEWQIGKQYYCAGVSEGARRQLALAINHFKKILPKYPGMFLEDKRISLAIHYRKVKQSQLAGFKKEAREIIKSLNQKDLMLVEGKKVFELRPRLNWNKGHFVKFISRHLQLKQKKHLLPVYVGDDTTDEDVFKMSQRTITIRVGKKKNSGAKYYIKNQKQINRFLAWLLSVNPGVI